MDDVNDYIDNNTDNDNDNWIRDDHNNDDNNVNHNSKDKYNFEIYYILDSNFHN